MYTMEMKIFLFQAVRKGEIMQAMHVAQFLAHRKGSWISIAVSSDRAQCLGQRRMSKPLEPHTAHRESGLLVNLSFSYLVRKIVIYSIFCTRKFTHISPINLHYKSRLKELLLSPFYHKKKSRHGS